MEWFYGMQEVRCSIPYPSHDRHLAKELLGIQQRGRRRDT